MKLSAQRRVRQAGLTLVELMVGIAISMTVLSGVVQVLVVSKSNFITGRELATLQENARFAMKYMSDEIRMAGFSTCSAKPLYFANSVKSSVGNWYLDGLGLEGFEYDEGINTFPAEFRADVAEDTDAIVVRRGQNTGLRVNNSHNPPSAELPTNKSHTYPIGQVMIVATPDCSQIGIFQMTGPNNANPTQFGHSTGISGVNPGNCSNAIGGNFTCPASTPVGTPEFKTYGPGSTIMEMRSEAYYIGVSATDNTIPALFRERLLVNTSTSTAYTASEELVQGVENMQLLYGLDNSPVPSGDGVADRYVDAGDVTNWDDVVSVRLSLRMRSIFPVYNSAEPYEEFEGIDDTDGADRFMRQVVSTTIAIRNS